jgi:hypothetical protein
MMSSLIPKPFRSERFLYHSNCSIGEFEYLMRRATAPKTDLIKNSFFAGDYFGHSYFKVFPKYYRFRGGDPTTIQGSFSKTETGKTQIEITVAPQSLMMLASIILFFAGVFFLSIGFMLGIDAIKQDFILIGAIFMLSPLLLMLVTWFDKRLVKKMFIKEFSLYPT